MEIIIKIPKEFENHFNSDKFEDSLQRVRFDIHKAMIAKRCILSGNYEIETLDMLTKAFLKGVPLPKGHGDLIDRKNAVESGIDKEFCDWYNEIKTANAIIKADRE